jgi:hypothetical protein
MARMTSGSGALFQEGPVGGTGRIIQLENQSQVEAMRRDIRNGTDLEGRAVLWQEIPQDQESFYMNPGGFSIRQADGTYLGAEGSSVNMADIDQSDVPDQAELERLGMAQGWNRPMSPAEWLGFQGVEGFINPSTGTQSTGGMIGQQELGSVQSTDDPLSLRTNVATSGDQQILNSVLQGKIIATSELAQIGDGAIREQAANQLAKNIVTSYSTADPDTLNKWLMEIYSQFITGKGALSFDEWSTAAGMTAGVPTVTGKTTVYFNDGTNELVDDSELTAFVAANAGRGATTDRDRYSPANIMGAGDPDFSETAIDPSRNSLFEQLESIGKSGRGYTHNSALDQIASDFTGNYANFPGWSDTGRPDNEFRSWLSDLYLGMSSDRRSILGTLFLESQHGVDSLPDTVSTDPLDTVSTDPLDPGAPGIEGFFPYGDPSERRVFSDVYGGFVGGLPGSQIPAVAQALKAAGDPLRTQFWMQQPDLPFISPTGGYDAQNAAVDFLNSLMQGTGNILQGPELGGALSNIASALTGNPDMLGIGALGMEGSAQSQLYDRFKTLGAQRKAFEQPFLLSTVGAPEKRSALQDAISRAATQFEYKYPGGVPIEGGTGTQNFLPWAISQNLLGIQDLLPSLAPGNMYPR